MISFILISIAAILNAAMDTLFDHFSISIFKELNPNFWNPQISWKTCKRIPFLDYPIDAWHICKSIFIIFILIACTLYKQVFGIIPDFFIFGICWNIFFNIFYSLLR